MPKSRICSVSFLRVCVKTLVTFFKTPLTPHPAKMALSSVKKPLQQLKFDDEDDSEEDEEEEESEDEEEEEEEEGEDEVCLFYFM